MNDQQPTARSLCLLLTALGGEGGGVLMNWIVAAARAAGHAAQATSIPGVAQRTGSTTYYVEIDPVAGSERPPVMALVPMPGRVDAVVSSELVETARVIDGGFVSPDRTLLISSTSRVYTTAEKVGLGDGRADTAAIEKAARQLAKQCHLVDLTGLAESHGTFVSATMFGALVGSSVLPWPVEISRGVLGEDARSLAGFDAACAAVTEGETVESADSPGIPASNAEINDRFAMLDAGQRELIGLGYDRCVDFQDAAYASLYLERLAALAGEFDGRDSAATDAVAEAARRLALWMTYEDIPRVADLKSRPARFRRIREETGLHPGQILQVTDYFKPRAEEIADMMPVGIGGWMYRRIEAGGYFPFLGKGRYVRSNGIIGYYLLRSVAKMRVWRRRSLRFGEEQRDIDAWLDALSSVLVKHPGFARALAELPRLRKGYSDTQQRGLRAYRDVFNRIVKPAVDRGADDDNTSRLRDALDAALADEHHVSLDSLMQTLEAGAQGVQPETADVH